MSNSLHKREQLRRKCRKCGSRLVNKPEYGAVCPNCGLSNKKYTDYEVLERENKNERS